MPTTEATGGTSGGVGGTTFASLSSISSDLSVSVAFSISSEMLAAAQDEGITQDELIGLVLGFTIVFAALQARLKVELERRRARIVDSAQRSARARLAALKAQLTVEQDRSGMMKLVTDEFESSYVSASARDAVEKLQDRRSILDFAFLLVSIGQRITVAVSVQLLASSVRAQQPSRLVRTVSLVGLAAFFVFAEGLTNAAIS